MRKGRMRNSGMVDYRAFRFHKLNTPEFRHLKYLLFWPVYGLLFLTVERLWIRDSYYPMHCALDDRIPFCVFFDSLFILVCVFDRDAYLYPFV